MREYHLLRIALLISFLSTMVSCDPDEPIVTPPHDCSYDNTVPAINEDTVFNSACVSINPIRTYPEGYAVHAVSFNPNDPDEMAILAARGSGDLLEEDCDLIIYNLCDESFSVIATGITVYDNDLQWSRAGRILYKNRSRHHTIRRDGTGEIEIAITSSYGALILNDGRLVFYKGNLIVTDSLGVAVDTIVILPEGGIPLDILADGRILMNGDYKLQFLDPVSGNFQVIDNTADTYYAHAAYVGPEDAVFWLTDKVSAPLGYREKIGLTDVSTQSRVFEQEVLGKHLYWGASASSNGRLATVRMDRQYLGGCLWNVWSRVYLMNADGTDERRLELPF